MSPDGYTEDYLVEEPAIQLFVELGWASLSAMDEVFGDYVSIYDFQQSVEDATLCFS